MNIILQTFKKQPICSSEDKINSEAIAFYDGAFPSKRFSDQPSGPSTYRHKSVHMLCFLNVLKLPVSVHSENLLSW